MNKSFISYGVDHLPTKITSNNYKLEFEILTWAEPNNGRMLWQANVIFNGKCINDIVFNNEWNYLNQSIFNLDLVDTTNRYYYIPIESTAKLFDAHTNQVKNLSTNGISTASFIGNQFYDNLLFELFSDKIFYYDLTTMNSHFITVNTGEYFVSIINFTNNKLKVVCVAFKEGLRMESEQEYNIWF